MTAQKWNEVIKKACKTLGTYHKAFDPVIDTLAGILEKRDDAADQYDGRPIISHTNSHGETNRAKNPALMLWADLNRDALAYWRDLGLTPAGLKRLNEAALAPKKEGSALEEALAKLGG